MTDRSFRRPAASTPLHALHLELGAKMVPFAGYDMPVQLPRRHPRRAPPVPRIGGAVRRLAHGPVATARRRTPRRARIAGAGRRGRPGAGKQRYGFFTNTTGGILDDLMITRAADRPVHGRQRVAQGGRHRAPARRTSATAARCMPLPDRALLALQGPKAVSALRRLAPGVARSTFMSGGASSSAGAECFVTRSGYTGEDGFEISVPADAAVRAGQALLAQPEVKPAGLGARDTLRLEAGLCLYGHDIDETHDAGRSRPHLGDPEGAAPGRRARRRLPRRRQDRRPARHRRAEQARRPGRARAHAGARRRGAGRRARPQARPRDQRHDGADREPADRDGLPGRQPRDPQPRGLRRGARQAPADARGPCPSCRTATTAAEPRPVPHPQPGAADP